MDSQRLEGTSKRIIDAAERLFAEHGIGAVSIRRIVAEAGVNLASVHYHFGSKDELVWAVFQRGVAQVNSKRRRELLRLRKNYGSEPIPLEQLLRGLLVPVVKLGRDDSSGGAQLFQLIARAYAETDAKVQAILDSEFRETIVSYLDEFERTVPGLPLEERILQVVFMLGAMVQTVLFSSRAGLREQFSVHDLSEDRLIDLLIEFCAGGLRSTTQKGIHGVKALRSSTACT